MWNSFQMTIGKSMATDCVASNKGKFRILDDFTTLEIQWLWFMIVVLGICFFFSQKDREETIKWNLF